VRVPDVKNADRLTIWHPGNPRYPHVFQRRSVLSSVAGRDKLHCRLNGESQRRAARDVERQMGANINTGQPDQRDGAQRKGAADRAEAGNGVRPQGDGDGSVPGQVPEPGGLAAAAAGPGKQRHRPRPAHYLLDQFRKPPGAGAGGEQPACQLAVSGQPRRPATPQRPTLG
jgi:hypothetical protein